MKICKDQCGADKTDECRLTLCCSSCPVEEGTRIGLILAEDLQTFWSKQIKKLDDGGLSFFHIPFRDDTIKGLSYSDPE